MEERREKISLIIRVLIALTLGLLGEFYLTETRVGLVTNLSIMLVGYVVISFDLYLEAIKAAIKEHEFYNEITLMIVASIGAFCLRCFGDRENKFFEAILVILFYQVGEICEDFAAERSKKSIISTFSIKEDKCNCLVKNELINKKAEELEIEDICIFGNGNKILCDGVVKEGNALVNESSLTGESMPIEKQVGDKVYSGTIVVSGNVKVEVTSEYKDSTVSKMIALIEESESKKSKGERFITRFAKVYTPFVFILAILIAVIPSLIESGVKSDFGNQVIWSNWLYTSLSLLVVACPCAILISVPLTYFSGIGLSSKNGIIVKGGVYFDQLNNLKTVCFDKTGTITTGEFEIVKLETIDFKEDKLVEILTAAESRSSHPLARAIIRTYGQKYDENRIASYEEIGGLGVHLVYDNLDVFVGKKIENLDEKVSGTCIQVKVDGKAVGEVVLADQLKENTKATIEYFNKKNIETVMISGDQEVNVSRVCKEALIQKYFAECSPKDKTNIVSSVSGNLKATSMYVGDGINDAPSISLADVGVAMGGLGADVAINSADAVIMNDDIGKVSLLHKIAKITRRYSIFDITFALIVKGIIFILALTSTFVPSMEVPLWVAVAGDSGLALLLILISFSLFFKRVKNP